MADSNDRGSIKWTSLMLPEHVEMIKAAWEEDEHVEKGTLDEQQIEAINFTLEQAVEEQLVVEIKYYNGSGYSYVQGKVKAVESRSRDVHCIQEKTQQAMTIKLDDILDMTVL
ncbi:YolD-like family protein [Thalassobacillus sp. CUG 92003]|uniref:YolD-like family protein n=1 Tax=Thalassobacillus sp. CUG 92003 TaxID=2736641 RepID=UPI0015E7B726|nr:YolD-like family protein [Thalassobacillus sp. CUG 92003]